MIDHPCVERILKKTKPSAQVAGVSMCMRDQVFSVEIAEKLNSEPEVKFYSSIRLKHPLEPNIRAERHFKLGPPSCRLCSLAYFSNCIKKELRAKAVAGCAWGFAGRFWAGGVGVYAQIAHRPLLSSPEPPVVLREATQPQPVLWESSPLLISVVLPVEQRANPSWQTGRCGERGAHPSHHQGRI